MESNKVLLGLLRRRQCLVPTLRGWLVLALSAGAVALIGVLGIDPFLAVTESVPGGVLVKSADGTVLGAVGISGDTSDQDEICVLAGIEAAGFVAQTGA